MTEEENMTKSEKALATFEDVAVRRYWDEQEEKWYFAVVDVVEALSGSPRPRKYWNALKTKLKQEGNEVSQKLGQLKMLAKDGKRYCSKVSTRTFT